MLSEKREKEIRGSIVRHAHVTELLAEIDRLRAENANMRLDLEWPIVKELDALKAEIEKLEAENQRIQDNRNTWKKDALHWYDENQRLKAEAEERNKWIRVQAELLKDSIAERNALAAENEKLKYPEVDFNEKGVFINGTMYEDRSLLVEDNKDLFKENQRLKERIEKLIEAILWASPCGQNWITPEQHPSYETIGKVMREAIVQDQKAEK